jgi:hypothetical protein
MAAMLLICGQARILIQWQDWEGFVQSITEELVEIDETIPELVSQPAYIDLARHSNQ